MNPLTVPKSKPIAKIAEIFIGDPNRRTVFVVDEKKETYLGYITIHMLIDSILMELGAGEYFEKEPEILFYDVGTKKEIAGDFMEKNPLGVTEEMPMQEAMALMKQKKVGELPVLDKNQKIIGELHILEVLDYWKTTLNKTEESENV
jgi:CBS domain-containing protein